MKLWIGRHAYAGSPSDDPQQERSRPLTPEGRGTAKAIAQAMLKAGEVPNVIFCSPYQRATDTADIYGKAFVVRVNMVGDFAPDRPLEKAIQGLIKADGLKRIMIVGHMDNTSPAMTNLGGDVDWPDLLMGEVRRVEMNRKDGSWAFRWRLKPSSIGRKDCAS